MKRKPRESRVYKPDFMRFFHFGKRLIPASSFGCIRFMKFTPTPLIKKGKLLSN